MPTFFERAVSSATAAQSAVVVIFACFAKLDVDKNNETAKTALLAALTTYATFAASGAIAGIRANVESGNLIEAFQAFMGLTTVVAATNAISGNKIAIKLFGITYEHITPVVFTAAFGADAAGNLILGAIELGHGNYSNAARFFVTAVLQAGEAWAVVEGLIFGNAYAAVAGAVLESMRAFMRLADQAPTRTLSAEALDKHIEKVEKVLKDLQAKKVELVTVSGERAALLDGGAGSVNRQDLERGDASVAAPK